MSQYNDMEANQYNTDKRRYIKPMRKEFEVETMKEVECLPTIAWTERGISKETMERFGVKVKISSEPGPRKPEKVFFPYRDKQNRVCGYKCKNLSKEKHEKFHFYAVGRVGTDTQLFGAHLCRKSAKVLFTAEGELDCLSIFQAITENTDEKYKNLTPAVVSIGAGTVNAVEHVANNHKFTKQYKKIVLCFDNDSLSEQDLLKKNPGMKGKEATTAVGNHLIDHDVYYIQWPDWINDANDYLQKGQSAQLNKMLLFEHTKYHTEQIVGLYDMFKPGELAQPMEKGVYLPGFPLLMDKMLGLRTGELTLMMATSGAGKSSISAELAYHYAEERGRVGGIFLEEGMKKTCNRFIARKLKIHPNKYKWNPLDYCTKEEFEAAEKWVADIDRFLFLDHYGAIKIENLVDFAKILIYKYKRELIVLDHISLTVSGRDDIDERVELEKAMKELAALCERSNVHIIVVAHVNRNASVTTTKERELTKPVWKRCFITDGKGTQALEALAWNIICIDMELLPDGTRGRIRLMLGKNREADELGFCDVVRMHRDTGVFYDASKEEWMPKTTEY